MIYGNREGCNGMKSVRLAAWAVVSASELGSVKYASA